mgnify:CR=1 FL=1
MRGVCDVAGVWGCGRNVRGGSLGCGGVAVGEDVGGCESHTGVRQGHDKQAEQYHQNRAEAMQHGLNIPHGGI